MTLLLFAELLKHNLFLSEIAGSLDGRNSQQMAAYSDYPFSRERMLERMLKNFCLGVRTRFATGQSKQLENQ
jgi:hypothetical protein